MLELLVGSLVLDVVVFGQNDVFTVADHVEVGAAGFERSVLRGVEQLEVAHQLGTAQALDFAGCRKAVEEHLAQGQRGFVATVRSVDPGAVLHRLLPARAGRQVDPRQETAFGHVDFFSRCAEGVPARLDLRALEHGGLCSFFQ